MPPWLPKSYLTIELPHPFGQVAIRCFHHEMVVIRHQTIGVAQPVEPQHGLCQRSQEDQSVFVVFENGLALCYAKRLHRRLLTLSCLVQLVVRLQRHPETRRAYASTLEPDS